MAENVIDEGSQQDDSTPVTDVSGFEFELNETPEDEQDIGSTIGEIGGNQPPANDEGGENEGGEGVFPNIPKIGGEGQQTNPEIAELKETIKELKESLKGVNQQTAEKAEADKIAKREAEKTDLKTKFTNTKQAIAQASKAGQHGKVAELTGQLSLITSRAEQITAEEKADAAAKEKAEQEAKDKPPEDDKSKEPKVPEAMTNWLKDNAWFDDPKYFQWRQAAQTLANQLVELKYDQNSPAFYKAIEDELVRNGFKKPADSGQQKIPGFGLNLGNKSGGGGTKPQNPGSPVKSGLTTKKVGNKQVVKLDKERSELIQAIGLTDDPDAMNFYKSEVIKNTSKRK